MESALNQTPSRPDNTPLGADTPLHPAAARHRIRELAAQFPGELEEPISDFIARLPDALLDDFSLLLLAFDSHVTTREMNRENIVWQAVTERLPWAGADARSAACPHARGRQAVLCRDIRGARPGGTLADAGLLPDRARDRLRELSRRGEPRGAMFGPAMPLPDDDAADRTRKNGHPRSGPPARLVQQALRLPLPPS